MAYTCPWLCVFDTVPSAVAQSVPSATVQTISTTTKLFAAALAGHNVIDDRPLPTPCIKGDALRITRARLTLFGGISRILHMI